MTTTEDVPETRPVLPPMFARWVLITVCTAVAFWTSLTRTRLDTLPGGLFGYMLLVPLVVFAMAIGITRRQHDELPIHDREVDAIVGVIAMALSVATYRLLVPRYRDTFFLLRTDLAALLLFVFGACVLLFGLRAVGRYWPVWLLLAVVSPLGYRTLVISLGGDWVAVALVSTVLVAIAVGIAIARTTRRALIGFVATLALGLVLLALQVLTGFPALDNTYAARAAPVTAGAVVALTTLAVSQRRDVNGHLRPVRPSPVTRPWKAVLFILATTAGLAVSSLPSELTIVIAEGPPPTDSIGLAVPAGWTQTDLREYDWADRFFGADSTLARQTWTADEVNPDWDTKGRRRTVVVDTLLTHQPQSLYIYPNETLYSTLNGRRSPMVAVDLGHGVVGQLYTIVDQELFLTWTKLNFEWTRGDGTVQVVNLITVDNHEPDATFPTLDPEAVSVVSQSVNVLMRGNAVVVDENPEYKDENLLTTLGRDVVARQWEVAA
ncbi:hypothetical protein ACFYVR_21865 [Rhodococcus sp. NPDC003318]|uniref:hypothetical protein n=1 Tax=Rhodococcus sp. NPDC003318 TaxID=3364503 RepID=UPI0036CC1FBD